MNKKIKFPLDMNGEPIKSGDLMVAKGKTVEVTGIGVGSRDGYFWGCEEGKNVSNCYPCISAFHKPESDIEMILVRYDQAKKRVSDFASSYDRAKKLKELRQEYAQKIKDANG